MNTGREVSTEELFRQWKGSDVALSKRLEILSEEVQFMLVSLVKHMRLRSGPRVESPMARVWTPSAGCRKNLMPAGSA